MRIVLTTESYLPYVSGVTVAVDGLARGLGARGHDVLVLAPRPADGAVPGLVGSPGPEPRIAWLDSYQLPRVAPAGYRMPWPNPRAEALRDARAFEPDIVHAHSPFLTGVFARRLARATAAPLVFTHHTRFADYGHYLGPLAAAGARLTDAYLSRFWAACAAVIAPSSDLADEIRSRAASVRVEVIPSGIDVAGIRALEAVDPRPMAGWSGDTVVVAWLGRLAPEKSPQVVLDAVAHAAERTPEVRLVVIGAGPSEEELHLRASAADLAGRVSFTGSLPRTDALAHLAGADLFAFASQSETQGLVLAEALASGLPVVAIDGPGIRDSVRDGVDGVVLHSLPTDTRGRRLGAALAQLVASPAERHRLAENARAGAQRFAIERRVEEVEQLYRDVS